MSPVTELVTTFQAAALYGCQRANMIILINSGRIPAMRLGNQWVLKRADVLALREARDARPHPNLRIEPTYAEAA